LASLDGGPTGLGQVRFSGFHRRLLGREESDKGKGADWEGSLITLDLYQARSDTKKFVPVLFNRHDEPFIPRPILGRKDVMAGIKQNLLAGGARVAITGHGQAVGMQGMGGIGKTVLAAALAHDLEVRQAFPDGIYRLTLGQKPKLLELHNQLFAS
jgi:hypothetical protein